MIVRFTKGYKYRLAESVVYDTTLTLPEEMRCGDIIMTRDGKLIILAGYSWDGATNAIDTDTIMLGALIHDALYELLRGGLAERCGKEFKDVREIADNIFYDVMIESGMNKFRAGYIYKAVRAAGFSAARCARKIFAV